MSRAGEPVFPREPLKSSRVGDPGGGESEPQSPAITREA
jgi:hypothetical protein